jgi:ATP synthase F0 subunit c
MFAYISAGICMGLGAIGSSIGIGATANGAIAGMARQPKISGELTKTMLIGMAITESPAIFALVTAIMLVFIDTKVVTFTKLFAVLGAGISMGLGALGPGIGDGYASQLACEGVARSPEEKSFLTRTMLIGQATAQSTSIYAFVVSLSLIMV